MLNTYIFISDQQTKVLFIDLLLFLSVSLSFCPPVSLPLSHTHTHNLQEFSVMAHKSICSGALKTAIP